MLKILICEDEKDWSDHFKNLIHEKFEKNRAGPDLLF